MRRPAFALTLIVVAACARKDEPSPPDTSAMDAGAAAPAIDLAALAGTWDLTVMGAGSDSVLTTGVLTTSAGTTGWTVQLPGRDPVPLTVTVSGDSIITQAPEYESVLRKGVTVQTSSTYWVVGGNLNGKTKAVYRGAGADSVVMLRATGTKRAM